MLVDSIPEDTTVSVVNCDIHYHRCHNVNSLQISPKLLISGAVPLPETKFTLTNRKIMRDSIVEVRTLMVSKIVENMGWYGRIV